MPISGYAHHSSMISPGRRIAGLCRAALVGCVLMIAPRAFGAAAAVTNVTASNANGIYKAGAVINIQMIWSKTISVKNGNAPYLVLNTSPPRNATYSSVSGTQMVFHYTVQAGDASADLGYPATTSLVDSSSRISATGGVDLTLPAPGSAGSLGVNKDIVIDAVAPTVSGIARKSPGNPTNAASVQYTVTFSESVTNVAVGNFTLTGTGVTGTVSSVSASSGSSIDVTVNSITGNGDLRLDLSNKGTIQDSAGNALAAVYASGQSFTIDHTSPNVVSIDRKSGSTDPTNATSAVYTVTFSESVKNVGTGSFVATTTSGTVTGTVSAVSAPTGSSIDVTVASDLGNGDLRLDLNSIGTIQDAAGNTLSGPFVTGQRFTFDHTAPTVISVTRKAGSRNPTNSVIVTFTVTFSEPVANLAPSCFTVKRVDGFIIGLPASVSSTSGTIIDVVVAAIGDGEYRLDVNSDSDIADMAGNPLATGYTGGETFIFDALPPTVGSIVRKAGTPNPTDGDSAVYTVTFTESVRNIATTNFVATPVSGSVTGTVTGVSATSGTSVDVTVSSITGEGDLRLDLNAVGSIQDAAGNAMNRTFNTGQSFRFDHTPPTVVSINRKTGSANPTNSSSVVYTVTFSENVKNIATSSFVATGVSGSAAGTVSGVSASSGTSVDVTVSSITGEGGLRLDLNDVGAIADAANNALGSGRVGDEAFLVDVSVPEISVFGPVRNATKFSLPSIEVTFTESVTGVSAADFTVNGSPATGLIGSGAGPYAFSGYATPADGTVNVHLAAGIIHDSCGNAFAGESWSYTKDSVSPVSSASVADQTRAGTVTLNVDFTASDELSGVGSTSLYVKAPGDTDFVDTGLEPQTGSSGTFVYTAAASNGLYQFATRAVDAAGNYETAPAFEDTHVLLNTVVNGAFVQTAQSDTAELVFPMTDDLDITITLTGAVAGETSLTVARVAPPMSFPSYFQHPEQLIQEKLIISAGGTFAAATLAWQYDSAGAPSIDRVYRFDGGAQPTAEFPVLPSGNILTIDGITSFSEFFAGNTVAVPVVTSWFLLE